jgi:hypothetical protein
VSEAIPEGAVTAFVHYAGHPQPIELNSGYSEAAAEFFAFLPNLLDD